MLTRCQKELAELIASIPRGGVRTLLAGDVASARTLLAEETEGSKTIVCSFTRLVDLDTTMRAIVRATAQVLLSYWPDWYTRDRTHAIDVARVLRERPRVIERWLRGADERARRGELPLSPSTPLETQAEQIALALDDLLLVLSFEEEGGGDPAHLYSFARAAEWIAEKTQGRVVVIVPRGLHTMVELDPIFYGAAVLPITCARTPEETDEPYLYFKPQVGKPHPFSEAEQALAAALAKDDELGPKFHLNQRVETRRQTSYLVDLLWPEGQLIIEVDGWATHGNRVAFEKDRHRDYELAISNYLVVRITNEEIREDLAVVLEKIRDLVRCRKIGGSR